MQFGVVDPSKNQLQMYDPTSIKMRHGRCNAMTFGNTHSVFGFCAAISEPLSHIISEILQIPALVYVDDVICFGSSERPHCTEKIAGASQLWSLATSVTRARAPASFNGGTRVERTCNRWEN